MADDWENIVIETGVDTLLDYLAEEGEASVAQISDDLGVSEDRIKEWAEALEDNDFVEKTYSARKGMILKYRKQNKEEIDRRLEEVKQEVEEETEKVQEEMGSRDSEIKQAKKKLQEMTEELEENREEEEEVKKKLEELEDLEEELVEELEKQEEKRERLHSSSVKLLSKIDNALNRIDEAEDKAESFEDREHEIRKKLKALKKLEKHSENVEELDRKLEELEEEEEKASGIFRSFRRKISGILGKSQTEKYDELLDGSVKEVKDRIEELENPDYKAILKAEKSGKDRKTLKQFLERRLDE